MKAVKQIIDYLRERGALSLGQLQALAMNGFLAWEDVFGEPEPSADPTSPRQVEILEDDEHEEPSLRQRSGGRKREVLHKGPVLEPMEICARLADRFGTWETELEGLVRLAQRLTPCDGWDEAAVVIRNAGPEAIRRAIREGIEARDPSLEDLWTALGVEGYREVVEEAGVHGPAVAAYRAILQISDPAQIGKHAWLLKEDEVGRVANLKTAQRRVLAACGAALSEQPDLFATALRRDRSGVAYWPLVLLYSARRGEPRHRPRPTTDERWPPREPPDDAGWMRAWAHATVMDPDRGPTFLVEHNARLSERPKALSEALGRALGDASTNSVDLLRLLDRHGFLRDDAVIGEDDPDAAEKRTLVQGLQGLRDRLEADQLLALPADVEAERTWEAMIDAWLRQRASLRATYYYPELLPDMLRVIDQSLGPAVGLLCPRSWDRRGWS